MVTLSAFFGAISGVTGTLISSTARGLSTGPTIVLCASSIVLLSLLFAPQRGLIAGWFRKMVNRRNLQMEVVLSDLYTLASQHEDPYKGHSAAVLGLIRSNKRAIRRNLEDLQQRGLVSRNDSQTGEENWSLTAAGVQQAQNMGREQ
jgi:manganese/zinc/iron transport system permease protein